ncbi:hypothetical protein CWB41_12945 [Methylovirgula ligni]|nr:hypothetical protein CWB41_12945 [Methylovirgula ligni]
MISAELLLLLAIVPRIQQKEMCYEIPCACSSSLACIAWLVFGADQHAEHQSRRAFQAFHLTATAGRLEHD